MEVGLDGPEDDGDPDEFRGCVVTQRVGDFQGDGGGIDHQRDQREEYFPCEGHLGVCCKLEQHPGLEDGHVPATDAREQGDVDVEDKEEVDEAGTEIARGPNKAQTCGRLASVVLDELGEQDQEPDDIADVATNVGKDAQRFRQVGVTVLF